MPGLLHMCACEEKRYWQYSLYIRWLLISLCAHMEYTRHFDLLKAFGYIERVVKSNVFFRKRPCYIRSLAFSWLSTSWLQLVHGTYRDSYYTVCTCGVNQAFRCVEGIWLHRKSRQVRFFFLGKDIFHIMRAKHVLSYHLIQVPIQRPALYC